jgi:hypothetical protein
MKITATVTGYGPRPGKTHALVDVAAEFNSSNELASFRVLEPDGKGDGEAWESGIARAMDLARKFADQGGFKFSHEALKHISCLLGFVAGSRYRSGRGSPDWIKSKNPEAPAMKREAEED